MSTPTHQLQRAEIPPLERLTAYVREDIAMGLELAAVGCDRERDRAAIRRGALLIRSLPTVRACRKCFERPASVERGDCLYDECHAGECDHA